MLKPKFISLAQDRIVFRTLSGLVVQKEESKPRAEQLDCLELAFDIGHDERSFPFDTNFDRDSFTGGQYKLFSSGADLVEIKGTYYKKVEDIARLEKAVFPTMSGLSIPIKDPIPIRRLSYEKQTNS